MKGARNALGALGGLVPGVAAIATVVLFLAGRPESNDAQLAIGLSVGLLVWGLTALLVGGELTSVTSASAETYEALRARVKDLGARLEYLRERTAQLTPGGNEAVKEAEALVLLLESDLELDPHRREEGQREAPRREEGSGYRWLLGHGYVNAWRDVHKAEDLLLAAEPREVVYGTAVTALDRLAGSGPTATLLEGELKALVRVNGGASTTPEANSATRSFEFLARESAESEHERVLHEFDLGWARALVRESGYRIHEAKNDAWDQIINLRNRLFATLVLAVLLTYALVVLAVLRPVTEDAMTAAVAFFLVGAIVGVFNELYRTSRRTKGTVFDYGLGRIRLMATPVLSGIAALGGILFTNLAGSLLISGTTPTQENAPTPAAESMPGLGEIFDLETYAMGLVVAAIFGLAPGLLLKRLGTRTDDYKAEIEKLDPSGTVEEQKSTGAARAPVAA